MYKDQILEEIDCKDFENIYTSYIIERLFFLTIKSLTDEEVFNKIFSYYIQYKNMLYPDETFQQFLVDNVIQKIDFIAIPDRFFNKDKLLKVLYCKNFIKSLKESSKNNEIEKSDKADIVERLFLLSITNSNISIYMINSIITTYIHYLDIIYPKFRSHFK